MDKILEYSLSIIWAVLEFLSCYIIFHAFLPVKIKRTKRILSFFVVALIMCIYSCLETGGILKYIITISLAIAWSCFAFKGVWLQHFLVAVISYIFSAIVDITISFGFASLLGLTFNELVWKKLLYIFIVTLAKLLAIFVAYLVFRLRSPHRSSQFKSNFLLLTMLFPAVSLVVIWLVFESTQTREDITLGVFILCCVLALANIAILYIIRMTEKNTKRETEIILLNQQTSLQAQNIIALEKSYRAQRRATHEFQNQLQTISDLLGANQLDTVKTYVAQLRSTQTTRVFCVNSHNPIIDAILNQKYQHATENAIEIQFQLNDLSSISIEPNSLVVLLSNLLDNAIEACLKFSGTRRIYCCLLLKDSLYLSIGNTSLPVQINGNYIETSKFPKEEHGYGLVNIQHILNGLNAEYTFEYADEWFQFAADIPFPVS